jgi:hypothetical protein
MVVPETMQEAVARRIVVRDQPRAKTLHPKAKRTEGISQVSEHLSSMWEALSSNPSTDKRKVAKN